MAGWRRRSDLRGHGRPARIWNPGFGPYIDPFCGIGADLIPDACPNTGLALLRRWPDLHHRPAPRVRPPGGRLLRAALIALTNRGVVAQAGMASLPVRVLEVQAAFVEAVDHLAGGALVGGDQAWSPPTSFDSMVAKLTVTGATRRQPGTGRRGAGGGGRVRPHPYRRRERRGVVSPGGIGHRVRSGHCGCADHGISVPDAAGREGAAGQLRAL